MVRVRFAPSPTGYLHIGNARSALFNWLFAKANDGKFILRIEDTDAARSSDDYFKKILDDLKWLGLDWDEGPDIGGPFGPYRQSERKEFYEKIAMGLLDGKKAYPCFCSEEELAERKKELMKKGLPPRYDNRCRNLTDKEIEGFREKGVKPALRFMVPDKKLTVNDLVKGEVKFDTALLGDFVIMKSGGTPTYHFAVVADDYSMEISHVIRGEDHLSNTPKHILLFEALGVKPPQFAHMSLTTAPGGVRLSKRTQAEAIAKYRELGYLPEALVNYFALLGWAPEDDKEIVSREEMISEFKIEKLSKSGEAFDPAKLNWIDGIYIRSADIDGLTKLAIPYLVSKKLISDDEAEKRFDEIRKIVDAVRGHLACLSEIAEYAEIFFNEKISVKDNELKKLMKSEAAKSVLNSFLENVNGLKNLDGDNFSLLLKAIKTGTGLKGKDLYMPIRAAITGEPHGPELSVILPILGKERCIARVKRALK